MKTHVLIVRTVKFVHSNQTSQSIATKALNQGVNLPTQPIKTLHVMPAIKISILTKSLSFAQTFLQVKVHSIRCLLWKNASLDNTQTRLQSQPPAKEIASLVLKVSSVSVHPHQQQELLVLRDTGAPTLMRWYHN